MITKLEIDGFKTFRKFEIEFSPLTVIAGTNASGKSNLFDALQLLSKTAEVDLKTAFNEQRGDASELFTQFGTNDYADEMFFGVEMLVKRQIKDNWGSETELKYTRMRYELRIKRVINERGLEDLFVIYESLNPLRHNEDKWVERYIPKTTLDVWRPKVITGKRGIPYIDTNIINGIPTISVPQDGHGGRTVAKREFAVKEIAQTILSGFNSVDFPHVFAAKEELRSWKFLQLDPDDLRKPSPYLAKDFITSSGENLAATLHRIQAKDTHILKEISRKLTQLLPNFTDVELFDDKASQKIVIKLKTEDGRSFSSRVLSEGTLRLLTLCILNFDDKNQALICFEEPENGIHPHRLSAMAELLSDLAVNFSDKNSTLRQMVVNTHSSVLVDKFIKKQRFDKISIWFSQLVTYILKEKKKKIQISKMLPVSDERGFQANLFSEPERKLTLAQVEKYLDTIDFENTIEELQSHG